MAAAPSLRRLTQNLAALASIGLCLLASFATAEEARSRGKLFVTPVEFVEDCSETVFARGETVMLTGSGLGPNEVIAITFVQGDVERSIGSAKANAQGVLSTRLPVPLDAATDQDARFRATAQLGTDGKGVVLSSPELQIFVNADDADKDGVKDMCDTCPDLASDEQFDSDGDGQGDACDKCPNDPENDADADGVCGDVDPD